jgi:hypothetical protein
MDAADKVPYYWVITKQEQQEGLEIDEEVFGREGELLLTKLLEESVAPEGSLTAARWHGTRADGASIRSGNQQHTIASEALLRSYQRGLDCCLASGCV